MKGITDLNASYLFTGTVRYMAPERLTGNVYTIKSDVWAFGFCLIELAIGRCVKSCTRATRHEWC